MSVTFPVHVYMRTLNPGVQAHTFVAKEREETLSWRKAISPIVMTPVPNTLMKSRTCSIFLQFISIM